MVLLDSLQHMRILYRLSRGQFRSLQQVHQIRNYSSFDSQDTPHSYPRGEVTDPEPKELLTAPPLKPQDLSHSPNKNEDNVNSTIPQTLKIHEPETSPNVGEDRVNRLTIRRTSVIRGADLTQNGAWHFNPNSISFETKPPSIGEHNENITLNEADELDDFERPRENAYDFLEKGEEKLFSDDIGESLNLDEERYEQVSTITASEKSAFHKIFKEIFERKQWEETVSIYGEPFSQNSDTEEKKKRQREASQQLSQIISGSQYRPPKTFEEMNQELERYPVAIRATAAEALGYNLVEAKYAEDELKDPPTYVGRAHTDTAVNPFGNTKFLKEQQRMRELEQRLEIVRETERERVESLMRAASTDFELWKVLEKEVFPLIQKLGLEDTPKPVKSVPSLHHPKKKHRKKTKSPKVRESSPVEAVPNEPEPEPVPRTAPPYQDALATEHGVSPLRLYGPLYPSYLLLSLRLLDRSFSRPSPLALALLPKIKSLGYISRVLGASTQFYNELLLIYHFRHNDFQGMLRLLEEMELSSLVMNQETLDIVIQLGRAQDRVRLGAQGIGMTKLWALPNFARGKFGPWRDYLRETLSARPPRRTLPRAGTILPRPKQIGL